MSRPMTAYYEQKLEQGLAFQDFAMVHLHRQGIVLQSVSSKAQQLKRENLLGLEIKLDDLVSSTGNLYFETHEKTNAQNALWVESGILRKDKCWLYGIGNYEKFYIFSKKRLKYIYERVLDGRSLLGAKLVSLSKAGTSKGMLLPVNQALSIAEKHFTFGEKSDDFF